MRLTTTLLLFAASVIALPDAVHPQPAGAPRGSRSPQSSSFAISQVKSYPFPTGLTASTTGSRVAWALNEQGRRNIWVAEGPGFVPRRLTNYMVDDGQELSSVSLSADGKYVVYLRGGDFGSNFDDALPVNPTGTPTVPAVQIWSVAFAGGEARALGEGENPVISPKSDVVAFEKDRQIWSAPIDGSASARKLFTARGTNGESRWSPNGTKLAFVSNRGDHAFIGIFANDSTPIRWIAPSTARDGSPRWAPNGREVAFVRRPGSGGPADSVLVQRHVPWSIWTGDGTSGEARRLWSSPETLRGSIPTTQGGTNLHWGANDRIVFLSYVDGQPHLYSISARGGTPLLLTPGRYMAEYISLSPDGRTLVFTANTGPQADDIDRRHVVKVPVDRASPVVMTPGVGLEWTPVVTGDGRTVAFISATAQRPPVLAVMPLEGGASRLIGEDRIPADFPRAQLVVPRAVTYRASDGVEVHAQLFDAQPNAAGRRPAVVFVHGGPPRQMLLGWHYSDYYSNAYALNQYLASRGYVVLAINFRLGIGYGFEFHRPKNAGAQGASEYLDVKAAGEYLRSLPSIDPRRIGIYGGSYGGFLTALALARDSDLFAAGVDIHGVHDWTTERARGLMNRERYEEAPDLQRALDVAWRSSPASSIATWKSPVLLIHGDDDRNVRFSQTVDLVQRLTRSGVPFEEIVIPDDTHHWLRHENAVAVNAATADFFDRVLRGGAAIKAER
jgi:dipeptidyl aminopeptidase/acylaminoacyl peptidase